MKNLITILLMLFSFANQVQATTFTGEVSKVGLQDSNQVVDSNTKKGIEFAKITIPQANFRTYTNANGNFELPDIKLKNSQPFMMNIEKEGYRPFSITINNNQSLQNPLKIEIAKSEPFDIRLDTGIIHLGDDNFSNN